MLAVQLKKEGNRRGALEALRRAKALEAQYLAEKAAAEANGPVQEVPVETGAFVEAAADDSRGMQWNAVSTALLKPAGWRERQAQAQQQVA